MITVLVTGVTGNTGVPILSGLVGHDGVTARAMTRRADGRALPAGVRPVVADFDTPETTTVDEITGRPARDVRQFAHDCADHFRGGVSAASA